MVQDAIDGLPENPRPDGARKLAGEELYRIRVGNWRVIYAIDDEERAVLIAHIRPRNENAYKNL